MKLWNARYIVPLPGGGSAVQEEDFYLPSAHDVRRQLRGRGFYPMRIRQRGQPLLEWMDVRTTAWQTQLLRALRFQSATASAGTALLNIIEGETDTRRRLAFLPSRTVLKGGGAFSDALKVLRLFDAATLAIIQAGEKAGDLKGVIIQAIEHVEEKGRQMKAFIAALGWLTFDIISVLGALWGTQFWFIPYLRESGTKATDPEAIASFQRSLDMISWINGSLLFITMGGSMLIVGIAALFWANRDRPEHFASKMVTQLPLFSSYLRDSTLNDTCKLLVRLMRGSVALDEAIKILMESSIEPSVRNYWAGARQRILAGVEPNRALARAPLDKAERDQIFTVQDARQLAEVYEAIASERAGMAKAGQRKIIVTGIVILMTLFTAVTLTMVYLLMIQNQGLMDSLTQMREGVG